MHYPAYVYRDPNRIYHAYLPDFPGIHALASSPATIEAATQLMVADHVTGARRAGPPASAAQGRPYGLPEDGYWFAIDLGMVFAPPAGEPARPRPM